MTRKQALTDLLAKVEAGEWFPGLAQLSFSGVQNYHNALNAYNGSLDAAKALHEAVLPGWRVCGMHQKYKSLRWSVSLDALNDPECKVVEMSDTPARAWLIAIIKALIAEEEA